MRKSFVLKDSSGKPQGYLMQTGESVRCMIRLQEALKVTLLFEGGGSEKRAWPEAAPEQTWSVGQAAVAGGYACAGERLRLSTGADAQQAFEQACLRRPIKASIHDAQKKRLYEKPEEPPEQALESGYSDAEREEKNAAFPQPRWPRPSCCPQARYADGRWQM